MNNQVTEFCPNCYFAIGLANTFRNWLHYSGDTRPAEVSMVSIRGCEKCARTGGIDNAKTFLGKGYAELALEELAKALDSKIVPNDDATTPVVKHLASNGAFVPDLAL